MIPTDLLLTAYRSGIFPMADSRDDPDIFWIEPKQRAILPLDAFHCSRSLAKVLKGNRFTVTCNAAFEEVIAACAAPRPGHPDSWINEKITASYHALHTAGHAHSIECWQDEQLVGGLYGVGFDRVFCGESMFSRATDASKVALAWLVVALRHAGARLLDCQFITEHLASLGAIEIPQEDYLDLLRKAQDQRGSPWSSLPEGFAAVLAEAGEARAGAAEAAGASSPGKFIAQSLTHTS
ncbi:leucyl/phenylalanyl-tRNA--protein transferase [Croceicoccus estronivorus]|nr:leucyl/phenylalanyl-tRNA--protein transferase [Croceicoccus estronivorus]